MKMGFQKILLAMVVCAHQAASAVTMNMRTDPEMVALRDGGVLSVFREKSTVAVEKLDRAFDPIPGSYKEVFNDHDTAPVTQLPHAAQLSNDDFIVVWNMVLDEKTGKEHTYGQLLSSYMEKAGKHFRIGTSKDHYQVRPRVATLPRGFVVVWGFKSDQGKHGVAFQLYNNRAEKDGDEVVVSSEKRKPRAASPQTAIAVNAAGDEFIITWQIDGKVLGRAFNTNGTPKKDIFKIATGATAAPMSICSMSSEYVVSWNSVTPMVKTFVGSGLNMTNVQRVTNKQIASNTVVVCIPGVGFAASFVSAESGTTMETVNGNGSRASDDEKGIYIRYFDESHAPITGDLLIEETFSHGDHSSVVTTDGEILTVWEARVSGSEFRSSHFVKSVFGTVVTPVPFLGGFVPLHEDGMEFTVSVWFTLYGICCVIGFRFMYRCCKNQPQHMSPHSPTMRPHEEL